MACKDILVHVGGAAIEARVRVAAELAEAHGAHLVGLHVSMAPEIPPYVEAQLSQEVLEAQTTFATRERERAQAAFKAATQGRRFSAEWRAVQGDAVEVLQLHGRHADLVVLGQDDPDYKGPEVGGVAGRGVLSLGRPVLVTPYVGTCESVGRRVMVAWDGSRAAARALGDAMMLLSSAEEVNVLSVNPGTSHASMAGVDISAHIARHGVEVSAQHITADDVEVGAMLLSRAADFGADMIVMGAYGHARWRELVLGGVTEHMLQHMTVPVLMSH